MDKYNQINISFIKVAVFGFVCSSNTTQRRKEKFGYYCIPVVNKNNGRVYNARSLV